MTIPDPPAPPVADTGALPLPGNPLILLTPPPPPPVP